MFRPQFGHHQASNEHTQIIKRWIQYGLVFVDRFLSREYVKGIYYKITNMIKRYKEYSQSYKYDKQCCVVKCCVDGYNFNNLIFYTLQDAILKGKVNEQVNCMYGVYRVSVYRTPPI
jgi:hypothetical protein